MSDPAIKTPQFPHQSSIYLDRRDAEYHGLFLEMGLGKSKILLDVASHLFFQEQIQMMIVLAPNAVYKNWISQEAPPHLAAPYAGMAYPKGESDRAEYKRLIFMDPDENKKCLKFLCMSYDSMRTDLGFEFLRRLLIIYPTMLVGDESTAFKSPSTETAKKIKQLGILAKRRWIATGTPAAQSPFDLHSQIEFLDPEFWGRFGLKNIQAFKTYFGRFSLRKIPGNRRVKKLDGYKRIETLKKIITPISSRLLKEDSVVKLPPKIYTKRVFEMTEEQSKLYRQIRYEFEADLNNGMYLEAPLAIVRLTRLQQITSGFVTAEERIDEKFDISEYAQLKETEWLEGTTDEEYQQLLFQFNDENAVIVKSPDVEVVSTTRHIVDLMPAEENPRLQLLLALIEECSHKVIVWCRFKHDVNIICDAMKEKAIRYDGKVKGKERTEALDRFRDPADPAQVFVANIHTISQGVSLVIAKTMIYFSNSFSLEKRQQTEDRFHRIGQTSSVHIIDLVAVMPHTGAATVDDRLRTVLRGKYDIAAEVTGDRLREWISD